jgi:hypothetical protein
MQNPTHNSQEITLFPGGPIALRVSGWPSVVVGGSLYRSDQVGNAARIERGVERLVSELITNLANDVKVASTLAPAFVPA